MREVYINMNPNEIESEYLNGVYNEIANTLGIEAAITIYSTYRGQQIASGELFHNGIYRIKNCGGI